MKRIENKFKPAPDRLSPGDSWRRVATSSNARGYGYQWQKARAEFLTLNPLCAMCKARGIVEAASIVDHIRPHHGDTVIFWDRSNWQALCVPCHSSRKQASEWREKNGR